MTEISTAVIPPRFHRPVSSGVFWIKSRLLIVRRAVRNAFDRREHVQRMAVPPADATLLWRDASPLYSASDPRERSLELGKVQNLRVASAAIDGIVLAAGDTFSFWHIVGRPSRRRGFVDGRELRQGCLVPSIGGGICQLTNALSRVSASAGMTIVERHPHSARIDGLVIDDATDATVFWNYIDFCFRAPSSVRIGATLTETDLIVRLDALP